MDEFRILSPTAILGYGFPAESFEAGMKRDPHLIAVDAGSTDPGPYYLGAGYSFTDRQAVKRDLQFMLRGALSKGIPLIIGSAGGSGGNPHLDWNLEIIKEIATEEKYQFKLAIIRAEIPKEEIIDLYRQTKVFSLPPGPELKLEDIDASTRIVAQMGMEPLIKALNCGARVILAGRCYDPAVFAALAVKEGFDKGLAIHLGKILECAAIAATPGSGSDCLMGYLHQHDFEVEPLNKVRRCTTTSVAAHTLYEKSNPVLLPGPGGLLDLNQASFEQVTERRVKVSGSQYSPVNPYRLKLEGARQVGYRTVAIAGTRDPIMIGEIDSIIAGVRERVSDNFREAQLTYFLDFKVYGKNGVMGALEPHLKVLGQELGIIIEAVAETQELANTICSFARSTMLHYGYYGRIATAGNLAFPYSPSDFKAGAVYAFSIYHLIEISDPIQYFPIEMIDVNGGESNAG